MISSPKSNCLTQLEFELQPKGLLCPKVTPLLNKFLDKYSLLWLNRNNKWNESKENILYIFNLEANVEYKPASLWDGFFFAYVFIFILIASLLF